MKSCFLKCVTIISCAIIISGCFSKTDSLIWKLSSGDKSVADQAGVDLVKMGAEAVDPLIKTLSNGKASSTVRSRAARILGELKDERAIPALIEALADPIVRTDSVKALIKIGKPASPLLVKSILSEKLDVQLGAIEILQELKEKSAVEPLCEVVLDKTYSEKSREKAMEALGIICGDQLPSNVLIDQLKCSPDPETRVKAAIVLKKRKEKKSLKEAISAITAAKDKAGILALAKWYGIETSQEYRHEIIKALSRIGKEIALPICYELLMSKGEIRMAEKWLVSGSPILESAAGKWVNEMAGALNAGTIEPWIASHVSLINQAARKWIRNNMDTFVAEEWLGSKSATLRDAARSWLEDKGRHLDALTAETWLNSKSPLLKNKAQEWVSSVQLDYNTAYAWAQSSNPSLMAAARKYLISIELDRATIEEWLNSESPALRSIADEWASKHGYNVIKEPRSRK